MNLPVSRTQALAETTANMDANARSNILGNAGVLASSQGNAFRAGTTTTAPAKSVEFAMPAARGAGVTTNASDAGKENTGAARGAAANASTSGEEAPAEKRWQVCFDSLSPVSAVVPTSRRVARARLRRDPSSADLRFDAPRANG
jgi:hypothetical protein|tara:strand:- start:1853 stop:2287 length:435 start_codon:yes stop_codon:yes gene_type:complete